MRINFSFKRVLSFLLSLCMVVGMVQIPVAHAAGADMLYLVPNANWKVDGARFAAYFFGNGETWVSMKDSDGNGVYEVAVPTGYPSVIFCRMNPNASANNWNNKWNQTADLTVPSVNQCYTVKESTWDKGGGTWADYSAGCTVTLNRNGVGGNTTVSVPEGKVFSEPAAPTAEGYDFRGWYTDSDCTAEYTFGNVITGDFTLYAKWVEITPETVSYTVSFNMNGQGSAIAAETVNEGAKVSEPTAPTASGYLFRGWFTDAACTTAYDFNASVNADLELFAKWLKIKDQMVALAKQDEKIASLLEGKQIIKEIAVPGKLVNIVAR